MRTYAERLNHAMELNGVSQSELARRVGIKAQAVQYICSGRGRRSSYTAEFARELGVNAEWLATGKGPMLAGKAIMLPDLATDERRLIEQYQRLSPKEQAAVQAIVSVLAGDKPV